MYNNCEVTFFSEKYRRASLLRELREELRNTKMIFNKEQLHLSNTIGQGSYIDTFLFCILVHIYVLLEWIAHPHYFDSRHMRASVYTCALIFILHKM